MKFLIVSFGEFEMFGSGLVKGFRVISEHLTKARHRVEVVCTEIGNPVYSLRRGTVRGGVRRFKECGATVFSVRNPGPGEDYLGRFKREIALRLETFKPDWVIVSILYQGSEAVGGFNVLEFLKNCGARVIFLAQNVLQLPFGPFATYGPRSGLDLKDADAVFGVSKFVRDFLKKEGGIPGHVFYLPSYGKGPFPKLGSPDNELITLVNPVSYKGVSVFLDLSRTLPEYRFGAVLTQGMEPSDLAKMKAAGNITLMAPQADIDLILKRTRLLLVPSLVPEAFCQIVIDAMLRGVPVLSTNLGGLKESKLGTPLSFPARMPSLSPGGDFVFAPLDTSRWVKAIRRLSTDRAYYRECARIQRTAALKFVKTLGIRPFLDALP